MTIKKSISILSLLALGVAAIPAFANTVTDQTKPAPPQIDVACIKIALDTRDSAISSAFDTYTVAIKSAITTRTSALKAGWDLTGKDRRTALKNAWKTYVTASRNAVKTMRSAKKAAWQKFYTDRRACGKSTAAEDATSEGADANL